MEFNMDQALEVIDVPARFVKAITGNEDFAGMANPPDNELEDLICDCGATSTLTSSLINCTGCEEKVVVIHLAQDGATMKSSHVCMKTYYVKDRTGEIRPITTKAYYVKSLEHDLLGGRALTKEGYCVILDKDPEIAGIYPMNKNGEINREKSFPFISERSGFFSSNRTNVDAEF